MSKQDIVELIIAGPIILFFNAMMVMGLVLHIMDWCKGE